MSEEDHFTAGVSYDQTFVSGQTNHRNLGKIYLNQDNDLRHSFCKLRPDYVSKSTNKVLVLYYP